MPDDVQVQVPTGILPRRRPKALLLLPFVAAAVALGAVLLVSFARAGSEDYVLEQTNPMHVRLDSVADALLKHAGQAPKLPSIPSSIASEAANAAKEVESGLHATAKLPSIPASIEKEVKMAEEEISIEKKAKGKKKASASKQAMAAKSGSSATSSGSSAASLAATHGSSN